MSQRSSYYSQINLTSLLDIVFILLFVVLVGVDRTAVAQQGELDALAAAATAQAQVAATAVAQRDADAARMRATSAAVQTAAALAQAEAASQARALSTAIADPVLTVGKAQAFDLMRNTYTLELSPFLGDRSTLQLEDQNVPCRVVNQQAVRRCLQENLYRDTNEKVWVVLVYTPRSSDLHRQWIFDYLTNEGFAIIQELRLD